MKLMQYFRFYVHGNTSKNYSSCITSIRGHFVCNKANNSEQKYRYAYRAAFYNRKLSNDKTRFSFQSF